MNKKNTIRCVILDDESAAIDVLKTRILEHANVEIVLATTSAFEALAVLTTEKIDLIFLDVHMPEIDGITFKSKIPQDIAVIYCSADDKIGSNMFDIEAVDYLNKPVLQPRFDSAMERYDRKCNPNSTRVRVDSVDDVISLQVKKGAYKMCYEVEIDYVLSTNRDVRVYLGDEIIPTSRPIIWFLEVLSPNRFIQISQSGIVARNRIRGIQGQYLQLRGNHEELKVSSTFKPAVLAHVFGKDT